MVCYFFRYSDHVGTRRNKNFLRSIRFLSGTRLSQPVLEAVSNFCVSAHEEMFVISRFLSM